MGVPAFYRWLTDKYPKIVVNTKEEDNSSVFVDYTTPNPNGMEFDNLYLDMNACIHPCFHPEDDDDEKNLPTTFDDVFNSIFRYVDRIFAIVRPRKLLYLAIDGVAPRAKMNQQRARRFQTAKNKEIAEEEETRLRQEYANQGKILFPQEKPTMVDDSNIITPGTEFMSHLSKAVQLYITERIRDNPGWREINVILSDSNVPGEGEHKIMSFIRSQRMMPGYSPNTRHCLYGLDADLIMLGLATHELHFSILREEVLFVKEEQPRIGLSSSSSISSFQNPDTPKSDLQTTHNEKKDDLPFPVKRTCRFQFLHVWILREYLELELQLSNVPDHGFHYDFERVLDDFIFICFFVGNDFLPHMPTLEIRECAIDLLMSVYKEEFKNLGGYLVDTQRVNEPHTAYIKLKRVEKFILAVGTCEELIFAKRTRMNERRMRHILSQLSDSLKEAQICDDDEETTACVESIPLSTGNLTTELQQHSDETVIENTKQLKEDLKKVLKERSDTYSGGSLGNSDKVKFGLPGWKERYYRVKFSADNAQEVESTRVSVVKEYTEGLCWVLLYYFSGVPSWTWFYPYHYGPCASDLKGLSQVKVNFQIGLPFTPFDQLMAVLPPRSAHALPKAYRNLMTDPCSALLRLYPEEFAVDLDGKRFLWQGISLLPFIDEKVLLSETKKLSAKIEEYEVERNLVKVDKLFLGASSKFGSQIQSLFLEQHGEPRERSSRRIEVSFMSFGAAAIAGSIRLPDVLLLPSDQTDDKIVLCLNYELPPPREIVHRPLAGVNFPEKCVFDSDIDDRMLWHEHNYHLPLSRRSRQITYPKMQSGEYTQQNGFIKSGGGRGWSSQGRGRAEAGVPSYPPANLIGWNSSSRTPQTYVPPHQRSTSARPSHYGPGGGVNMMRSGCFGPSGSGRGFLYSSNSEFHADAGGSGQQFRPNYGNSNQRGGGRGRGYSTLPTDKNRGW